MGGTAFTILAEVIGVFAYGLNQAKCQVKEGDIQACSEKWIAQF